MSPAFALAFSFSNPTDIGSIGADIEHEDVTECVDSSSSRQPPFPVPHKNSPSHLAEPMPKKINSINIKVLEASSDNATISISKLIEYWAQAKWYDRVIQDNCE